MKLFLTFIKEHLRTHNTYICDCGLLSDFFLIFLTGVVTLILPCIPLHVSPGWSSQDSILQNQQTNIVLIKSLVVT